MFQLFDLKNDSVNLRSPSPNPQGLTNDDEVGVQSVDGVSNSPCNLRTNRQQEVGRGLPSIDDTETPARPKKEGKKMEEKARIPKKEEKTEQKKEDVKINKTRHRQNIYVKAIGMIKQVNTMLDTFEGIGLKMDFDDDKTPVGKVMNVMLQNPKDIACEALGVELREEKGYNVGINDDHLLPVTLEVYYPASGRVEFSITFESLWDLLDRAGQDAECAKNIWDCFVNEKEEAREMLKNKYNATGFGEVDEK